MIAINWGSSNFRAYKLDAQGNVEDEKGSGRGAVGVPVEAFWMRCSKRLEIGILRETRGSLCAGWRAQDEDGRRLPMFRYRRPSNR